MQIKDAIRSVLSLGRLVGRGVQLCVSRTSGGTTYGKTCGILPVEANRGDEERGRGDRVSVCVYVSVGGGQTKSDKSKTNRGKDWVKEREKLRVHSKKNAEAEDRDVEEKGDKQRGKKKKKRVVWKRTKKRSSTDKSAWPISL